MGLSTIACVCDLVSADGSTEPDMGFFRSRSGNNKNRYQPT